MNFKRVLKCTVKGGTTQSLTISENFLFFISFKKVPKFYLEVSWNLQKLSNRNFRKLLGAITIYFWEVWENYLKPVLHQETFKNFFEFLETWEWLLGVSIIFIYCLEIQGNM